MSRLALGIETPPFEFRHHMTDPRLNSVHLELPRRQNFRSARDVLLNARGDHTLCVENHAAAELSAVNLTAIQKLDNSTSIAAKFVLVDRDYVYPLKTGLNTVGRMPDNDVIVEDAYVSRRHCAVLIHANDHCELHDVASKN